jgi:hypothetical protein
MRRALHKRNTARRRFVTEILSGDFLFSFSGKFDDDYNDVRSEQKGKSQHRKKRNQS